MRNLTKALAAISLLVPTGGHALGIGDIKLHSALNQNLKAEISLVGSGNEDVSDIKVKLAPPEKFDEAGVPWSYFLSKIKFKTEIKSNGSVVIKLSSSEALKEPFLDFLLEVTWPQGSLYREFTVLVDPPATYARQPKSVTYKKQLKNSAENKAAATKSETFKVPPNDTKPTIVNDEPVSVEKLPTESNAAPMKIDALGEDEPDKVTVIIEDKARHSSLPAIAHAVKNKNPLPVPVVKRKAEHVTVEKSKSPPNSVTTDKDGAVQVVKSSKEYGPTQKKSNLYRIAREVNTDPNVSVEQMMNAIYKANPEAFYNNNIDSLRANQILKIPAKETISTTVVGELKKDIELQHKPSKTGVILTHKEHVKAKKLEVKAKKRATSKLKLRPPHEHKIAKQVGSNVTPISKVSEQENDNQLVNTNQDLQIQLKKMREQLATMEKLLSIKDQKLASLEKSLKNKVNSTTSIEPISLEKNKQDELAAANLKGKTDAELKAKADADAKIKAAADLKGKTDAELKAKSDADAKIKAAADLKGKTDAELKAKADADAKIKAAADLKGKTDAELKAKADADAKIKAASDLKGKTDAELKAKADADAKIKAAADLKAKTDAELKAKADADAKIKAAADLKAKTDAELKAKADADAKIKAAADLKAKTDAELKAKADVDAKIKAAADLKAKADAELKAKADAKVKAIPIQIAPANNPPITVNKPLVTIPEPVETEVDLLSDPYILGAAAGGTALLGIWGWLFWRKRKVESSTEVESIFTESTGINLLDDEEEFSVSGIDDNSSFMFGGESSFLSDNNDFDAFEVDQDEVDPISEADVYLAYGRYQQAEELIRQAIHDHPDRDECKFKLLEIFCVNGNTDGFEEYVRELANTGKKSNKSFWAKVMEMGQEIIPDSPLLTMQEQELEIEETTLEKTVKSDEFKPDFSIFDNNDEENDNLEKNTSANDDGAITNNAFQGKLAKQHSEFDLSMFDEEPLQASTEAELKEQPANNVEFDLSMFDEEPLQTSTEAELKEQPANNVEFDLSMFDEEPLQTSTEAELKEQPANNVEFDLSMFDEEPLHASTEAELKEQPANNVEFDLSMFDEEPLQASTEAELKEQPANNVEFDLSMFDEEPLQASTEAELKEQPANNVEFDLSMFDEEPLQASTEADLKEQPANNVEFDLSMFDEEPLQANTEADLKEQPTNNVEFDLSMFDEEPLQASTEADLKEQPANNVEFDLSMFDEELLQASTEAELKEQPANNVEFDLSMFDEEPLQASTEAELKEQPANNVEFDLSMFDEEPLQASTEAELKEQPANNVEFDLSMFDSKDVESIDIDSKEIEFDLTEFEKNIENSDDSHLSAFNFNLSDSLSTTDGNEFADLDNMNMLETKIALAKAYIDMEDFKAARDIAEKVLLEGSEEQKSIAQQIISSLP